MRRMKLTAYSTSYKGEDEIFQERQINFVPDGGEENHLINIYPGVEYQTFEGFGGALTESAGYVFSQMTEIQKEELLGQYFDGEAMNYRMVRIPIDSCDFSLGHYEAVEEETDKEFVGFQLKRVEQYIFPLLNQAEKKHGSKLEVMLTPWSPPAYMKTNGDRNGGGKLKIEYKQRWADYICRYIKEYRKRGYLVRRISIQNEPKAVQTWDSCVYTAEEEKEFLRDFLWPSLQKNGLSDIEIFIWDHNKERAFERACAIIDETTVDMVAGIAFHWYSGDHFETLRMLHEKFPDKKLILSEACIEYSKFSSNDYLKNAQKYAHDIIGNINNGMTGFYDWNIVLNAQGGPNHVQNFCDAPFLYDTEKRVLLKRSTARYLWHFSHYIQADAVRIGFSSYTDKVEVTAFKNPDDTIVLVLLNRTSDYMSVNLRLKENITQMELEPDSITTVVI